MTDLDDIPDLMVPLTQSTVNVSTKRCGRHQWSGEWVSVDGRLDHVRHTCRRCGQVRDEAAVRRNRNNAKRGKSAELTVARVYGGVKIGGLNGPVDIRGRVYATQLKSHKGLPPTWYGIPPAIRVTTSTPRQYVWICTSVLGSGHLAYAPTIWEGIFDAMDQENRTPRLIDRYTRQGERAREWVIVRRLDEPGGPDSFSGQYVAWTGDDWLDRYGRDDDD